MIVTSRAKAFKQTHSRRCASSALSARTKPINDKAASCHHVGPAPFGPTQVCLLARANPVLRIRKARPPRLVRQARAACIGGRIAAIRARVGVRQPYREAGWVNTSHPKALRARSGARHKIMSQR